MLNQVSWGRVMQVRQGRTVNNSGRDGLTMLALLMKLCLLPLQNSRVNTWGEQTTAIRGSYLTFHLVYSLQLLLVSKTAQWQPSFITLSIDPGHISLSWPVKHWGFRLEHLPRQRGRGLLITQHVAKLSRLKFMEGSLKDSHNVLSWDSECKLYFVSWQKNHKNLHRIRSF